ncbi:MAG: tetratricopeptide repeat protein [Deltaproteobacteria bacterium]|nr:MAG: tetratricopeptide repeat protein [Deltaproteobacteria bacterium]
MRRSALALAALLVIGGCQSPEERVAEHRARADEYILEGKANEALLELRSALKADATNAETCRRIARLYEALGDKQQAYFFFLEASRLAPDDLVSKLEVARLLLGDDPDEAARLTEEVLERAPDNAAAWLRLTEVRLVQADADAALAAALTAVELSPDDPNTYHQVGRVHEARYRRARLLSETREERRSHDALLEEALAAFDQAAVLYARGPGGAENQLERARVLSLLGREEEAEAAFETALAEAANPQQQGRVLRRALEFGGQSSPKVYNWALEEQMRLQPRSIAPWLEYAQRTADASDFEAGLAVLDRMIEANPTSGSARVAYAEFLARHDQRERAIAYLAEAEADPAVEPKPPIGLTRASMLLRQQDIAGARAVAQRLEADAPDAPETALLNAQLALLEGRVDAAIETLTASVESTGGRLPTRRLLAQSYHAAGDRARAAAELNEILAIAPRDADMLSLLGQIQVEQGLPREALRTFLRLDRLRALTPAEQLWVARSYYGIGRPARGRAILMRQLAVQASPKVVMAYAENELDRDPERVRELLESLPDTLGPRQHAKAVELLTAVDIKQQDYAAALQRINELFDAGQGTPATLLLRAKVLLAMGQTAAGERDLLAVLGRGDVDTEAVDLLVRLYGSQGRAKEAIASFEEASEAGVLSPETRVVLARLYMSEGEMDRAIELLDEALEARDDLPYAKNDLAYLLADEGQELDRALELAQAARAALPSDPNAADTLGWVYLRRGLSDPAIEQFRAAIQSAGPQTNTAIFHHHLGLALRDSGNLEEARREFEIALETDPEFAKKEEALAALEAIQQSG